MQDAICQVPNRVAGQVPVHRDLPMRTLAGFYRDCLGCTIMGKIVPEWIEVDAGGREIALQR